jgi:succinate dehydrogenase/fumarate reductase cytochrome b subunit
MSDEKERFLPSEVKNAGAQSKYVVHWITHVRKRGLGMWAWLLHRVTAVLALFGVVFHVLTYQFGYRFPGGRLVTLDLMLFTMVYHMFNGVRVMLIETFGWAAKREDRILLGVLFATVLFIAFWIYKVGL